MKFWIILILLDGEPVHHEAYASLPECITAQRAVASDMLTRFGRPEYMHGGQSAIHAEFGRPGKPIILRYVNNGESYEVELRCEKA